MMTTTQRTTMKRVAMARYVGSAIESYDFYIYRTAAALVLPKVFFPHLGTTMATVASMATFAAAFISRPVGAAFLGHFGDRPGRKTTLTATLLIGEEGIERPRESVAGRPDGKVPGGSQEISSSLVATEVDPLPRRCRVNHVERGVHWRLPLLERVIDDRHTRKLGQSTPGLLGQRRTELQRGYGNPIRANGNVAFPGPQPTSSNAAG
jgi:hypothetical protein